MDPEKMKGTEPLMLMMRILPAGRDGMMMNDLYDPFDSFDPFDFFDSL